MAIIDVSRHASKDTIQSKIQSFMQLPAAGENNAMRSVIIATFNVSQKIGESYLESKINI